MTRPLDPIEVSKTITDEYCAKILIATYQKPKSAIELSNKFEIPIAACYRRIHSLEALGLIRCVDSVLTKKGKHIKVYKSQLKSAYIFFERGKLRVRFELDNGVIVNHNGDSEPVIEPDMPPFIRLHNRMYTAQPN